MAASPVYPTAAVFDLDGVVTFTARVHAAAWKELFDSYMHSREKRFGEPFRAFDADADHVGTHGRQSTEAEHIGPNRPG